MKDPHKEYISRMLIDMYYPDDNIYYTEPTRFERFKLKLRETWHKLTRSKKNIHSNINEEGYIGIEYRHRSFRDIWNE